MREYECLYILTPQLAPEDTEPLAERFNQVITDNSGEVLSTNPWGKRRLAYEIGRSKEGYYVQVRFNGEEITCKELDRALRFSEDALRHLIVRAEDLDPADSAIPEQLPEPGSDDYEDRRGYRRRSHEPAPERAPEAAAEAAEEGAVPADADADAAPAEGAAEDGAPAEPAAAEPDAVPEAPAEEPAAAEEPPAVEPAAEEPVPADEQPESSPEEG